jgi:hypothetical protein
MEYSVKEQMTVYAAEPFVLKSPINTLFIIDDLAPETSNFV